MDWTIITDQLLLPAVVFIVWFILMRFILPRLGVST
jgi:hypothetical protein